MPVRKLWVAFVAGIMVSIGDRAAAQPDQYLCVPDQSIGFRFDKASRHWAATSFSPTEKYVLRTVRPSDLAAYGPLLKGATWGFFQVGEKLPLGSCKVDAVMGLTCFEGVLSVDFDQGSGRFQTYARGNYVDQAFVEQLPPDTRPKQPDTPFIEIGTCTAF